LASAVTVIVKHMNLLCGQAVMTGMQQVAGHALSDRQTQHTTVQSSYANSSRMEKMINGFQYGANTML